MREYTEAEFENALVNAGVRSGSIIVVHSALFTLGRLKGVPATEVPRRLTDSIMRVLGRAGVLVVPTFNWDFCKGEAYDRQNSPAQQMGALSDFVLNDSRAGRTRHPMQSLAVIAGGEGEAPYRRKALLEADTRSGYGKGSAFDLLVKWNARLVLVGCDGRAASLIHYVEERVQVPYRYMKTFEGPYIEKGQMRKAQYEMFVRKLDIATEVDETRINVWLGTELKAAPVGGEFVRSCDFKTFVNVCEKKLRAEPDALLTTRKQSSA